VIARAKETDVKVRQAADTARKTAATVAFFTAFSILIGAFIAAVAATIAGHRRDKAIPPPGHLRGGCGVVKQAASSYWRSCRSCPPKT
jgi:hypothetical protein